MHDLETDQLFTISDASALSGLSPGTLKLYEANGDLKNHPPKRDSRGVRLYSMATIVEAKKVYASRLAQHGRTGRRRFVVATSTVTGDEG